MQILLVNTGKRIVLDSVRLFLDSSTAVVKDKGFSQELDRHSVGSNVFAKPCSVTWVTPPSIHRTYTDLI